MHSRIYNFCSFLFILPIRDGNGFSAFAKEVLKETFYTSYKGWKLESPLSIRMFPKSFYTSYKGWKLLRIEPSGKKTWPFYTSYKGWKPETLHPLTSISFALFILPIRDGNIVSVLRPSSSYVPFYTSYKGWKPAFCATARAIVFTFYTSYKGWKHGDIIDVEATEVTFYTSYKGWKHKIQQDHKITLILFILPIRDGNLGEIKLPIL